MVEKKVSVRLAAVGGRQVRAELEGVGEAGKRGFGRLSQEMEAANARLAGFARRVKVAAAAAVAAAMAAGVAMVRSGLQTVDAQAKLAQSLGTTVASIQTLERAGELAGVSMSGIEQATKDLTRRLSQAAAGGGPAAQALERLGLSASDLLALPLDERVGAINAAIEAFVPVAERAAVAGQLFGEEGSIAMSRIDTATLRQATEDVRAFGVVVSEQDADQIERTNDAISRLGLIWRGLSNQLAVAAAPALEAVADAMAALASRTGPLGQAITGLFDNIGRLTTYAVTFSTFLAGRWIKGMVAAALSVRGLATALVVLRGALIRTGIGALVVGAGELVHQFTRLVSGAGGLGNAIALLGDLATEVWERIKLGAASAGAAFEAGFAGFEAAAASALQGALEAVVGFANATVNSFEGAFEAIKAIWGLLPAAIGDLAFQAANSLIAGVEAMLNGVVARINGFISGVNAGLEALGVERRISIIPVLDLGQIENRFEGAATNAATAAQAAFDRAFADNPLSVPDLGLAAAATAGRGRADAARATSIDLAARAAAPLGALDPLRAAVAGSGANGNATTEAPAATERLNATLGETETALGRAGSAASGAGGALKQAAEVGAKAWDGAKEAIEGTKDLAKGLADDITGPLKEALKSGELSWQSFAQAVSGIAQNLANRLIESAFKPIENALFRAFSGSAGSGGGLFGWISKAIGGLFGGGFAKGGVFAQTGQIAAFARGGVIDQPTVFPFARGIGLMGEAGPEAILPLRRGPGGRLGVEAGTAQPAPQVAPRIINVLDPALVGDYLATPAGERAIVNVIRRNQSAFDG
ncbi:phage tail tape measure protein [Ponticoccus sp. SC2-23]|nr:phage tail tape measure protein [Ponticoccus sp. SC6-9]MBM1227284.1 phage tail tape measure protein [Ponticoccus sp. SC6-15]MBM1231828.1 phage tail tape measure protein [Ponticoccus sp. SC6-38]MBM1235503.1 phage tail tape measure protein [Ponticoccus sp. SC6-45]MBM1240851.1 phage tail tape measure protein [Ponticoccus sp. SC6-49]MBM1245386.1 phage tail tape measure protein [Ponticoccus sp. SC2-64]MBM1249955.1 phage tail tape measure protein [Ponticoccus sp. SC6-42]MBM1254344.1 phage tail 